MKRPSLIVLICLLFAPLSWGAIDTYEFTDENKRELFRELTGELRCPKCQNQNLSDSNSPIASDMRREIYRMLEEGQSGDEVVDFMVARYGDFVRYRPKRDESTWVLWYGPILLLASGAIAVFFIARRRRSEEVKTPEKSEPDQQKLKEILKEYKDDPPS